MAVAAAITLNAAAVPKVLQAVYTAGDANKLTTVTCSGGVDSVLISNRTGATLLVQTVGVTQGDSVSAAAFQLVQGASLRLSAADVGVSPRSAWTFGLGSAGSAVSDLMARTL